MGLLQIKWLLVLTITRNVRKTNLIQAILEHTKKHHTEAVELKFLGPARNRDKAVTVLRDLGFVDVSDSIPWREAFPDCNEQQHISAAAGHWMLDAGFWMTEAASLIESETEEKNAEH